MAVSLPTETSVYAGGIGVAPDAGDSFIVAVLFRERSLLLLTIGPRISVERGVERDLVGRGGGGASKPSIFDQSGP